ncbi:FGGY family of carbohydrate kinase [Artemisia annua]|uniref:FGGY family of carbohydrate kinase n=1 Tax=Artemisia annua TaxID=35608 RepID=A0A2U1N131_ARTAN|nr:FGGY family of carbohydrate kinase [Artemisia annua]
MGAEMGMFTWVLPSLDFVTSEYTDGDREVLMKETYGHGISLFQMLNDLLANMMSQRGIPFIAALTSDLHVLPDFHGNRSPIADPNAKGIICDLNLDTSEKQLALQYFATV